MVSVRIKESLKAALDHLGVLDYCVFLWEDQIKRFSLFRLRRNLRYRVQGAPDGVPIPPAYLIWLVVGRSDIQAFLDSGSIHAHDVIQGMLAENDLDLADFDAVLDFGCGCGRIMRYWKELGHPRLYGSDYNATLIRWCRRHLPFAQFETNRLVPPLEYSDGMFDFVYARSVFTHLDRELQFDWMEELHRVLRPRGYLLFTVSGDQFLDRLRSSEVDQYRAGQLVVRAGELEGKNYCAVYHPPEFVRQELVGDGFEVVDFTPGDGAKPFCRQDTYLLRRRRDVAVSFSHSGDILAAQETSMIDDGSSHS